MRENQDAAKGEVFFNFKQKSMKEEKEYGLFAVWIDIGLLILGTGAGWRLYTGAKRFLERNN